MKKRYIEPKITVVALNVRDNILISASGGDGDNLLGSGTDTESAGIGSADSREIIQSPDAWEEW